MFCWASGAARDAKRDAAARTRTLRGLTDRRAQHTSVQLHGRTLTLEQSPCAISTGLRVWAASEVLAALAAYDQNSPLRHCGRVVELGAGCGVAGLALALGGAAVTFTDLADDLLEPLRRNVEANLAGSDAAAPLFATHRWGTPPANLDPPYDLVIGADVAVDDHLVAPLVASVVALCGAHTVAILATEERGTHRLLHAALRRAFRRVEFVRRSTVRRCLARAEVDTAPADWVAVAVCRGVNA